MSTPAIKTIAVIGAGTMGGGIAALAASAGFRTLLLDMPPDALLPEESAQGLSLGAPEVRNRLTHSGWRRQLAANPPALFGPGAAGRVALGNTGDHFEWLADADWIIEAIAERLEPKRALMARIDGVRKSAAIVSSNTSGISIGQIAAGRTAAFQAHFLGTHFFNPPRYLKLLEVIPTAETNPAVVQAIAQAAIEQLGKGVVRCADRPGFIANRLGAYMWQERMWHALEHGYGVEEVDVLTGPLIGNPRTGTFRLTDLVGLDIVTQLNANQYAALPEDECRERFLTPAPIRALVEAGQLGNKTGGGIFRRTKTAGGVQFEVLDLATGRHEPLRKPAVALAEELKSIPDVGARLRAIFDQFDKAPADRQAEFVVETTLRILAYAARRVPEISDSLRDIDNAMRWGFNAALGPFEMWDAIGLARGAALMRARGISLPAWVDEMLVRGEAAFYQTEDGETSVYSPVAHVRGPAASGGGPNLDLWRGTRRELAGNASASIFDLDDGVICLTVHTKGNTLDRAVDDLGHLAADWLEAGRYRALVVGNAGKDFCLGANIGQFLAASNQPGAGAAELARTVERLQSWLMRLRFCRQPVIAALQGRALGGGAEVAMACDRVVVHCDGSVGLVEPGVGLIPAAGGCKELMRRRLAPDALNGQAPADAIFSIVDQIMACRTGRDAFESVELSYLAAVDQIVLNADLRLNTAKQWALDICQRGYQPPDRSAHSIYAAGRAALAQVLERIDRAPESGGPHFERTDYNVHIAATLAEVLCGGPGGDARWVTEDEILALERAAFGGLLTDARTRARIDHMLANGRPLVN